MPRCSVPLQLQQHRRLSANASGQSHCSSDEKGRCAPLCADNASSSLSNAERWAFVRISEDLAAEHIFPHETAAMRLLFGIVVLSLHLQLSRKLSAILKVAESHLPELKNRNDPTPIRAGRKIMLPIILLLGPCGIGKGTFASTLTQEYNIHHLSCGDWLRSKTVSPILGVSDTNINDYVALDFDIPEAWLIASYGSEWKKTAPPALILYVCSKRNESTPASMWIRALPGLRSECEMVSSSGARAILLDNFPKTLIQSVAFDECFGKESLPVLAISLTCGTDVILDRFLSRSRGNDDVKTFERRLRRFEMESPAVIQKYRNLGKLVQIEATGTPEEVYQKVMGALKGHKAWRVISCDTDQLASRDHRARLPSVVTKLERSRAKKLSPVVARGFSGSGPASAPISSPV